MSNPTYCPETQAMADLFPESFRLRQDLFSVGQQLLNPAAQQLASFKRQLRRNRQSVFLSTFPLDTLDLLYRIYLGPDFQFARTANDPRQIQWRQPTIVATIGVQTYPVAIINPNTIGDFEQALPNRFQIDQTLTLNTEVLAVTLVGQLNQAVFNLPDVPGYLYLTLAGAGNAGIMQGDRFLPIQVFLSGITTKGTTEDEIFTFPGNLTLRTQKRYQQVLSIKAINVNQDATLALSGAEHQFDQHLDLDFSISVNRQDQFVIWNLDENQTLNCQYFVAMEQQEVVLSPYLSWQLLDEEGAGLAATSALSLVPGKDYLAVVSDEQLLFYDKNLEYPDKPTLALLQQRTDNCQAVIDADSFFALPGDAFPLRAYQMAQVRNITSYTWQVAPPGGVLAPYLPVSGILTPVPFASDALIRNTVARDWQMPKDYIYLNLNQAGYWTVALTCTYQDGSQTTDVRLIGALAKNPIASFSLGLGNLENVFVDDAEHLWVVSSGLASQINFYRDVALVDYEKKLIYLRELYDSLEVIP